VKVLVVYGSTRDDGNTETLTERVVEGLDCTRVYLRNTRVEAIQDRRHDPEGFRPVDDDHYALTQQLLAHDVVVFATPLYWYGMSGPMKDYFDRWSQALRDARFDFRNGIKGKKAYVVVTGGGQEARLTGLPLIQQFQLIFAFAGMEFVAYLIGAGGKPGQILEDERAMLEAAWLNRTLKQMNNA